MASDYFLKLEGVKGESADRAHPDEIEILSFSWGVTQSASATGGGGGAGKAVFQDMHFTTNLSSAGPQIFLKCATGEHIKKATLTVRKSGGDGGREYYKITLEDLLISSYQQGGGAGDDPTDEFSLDFARIQLDYTPPESSDGTTTPVKASYDLKANKKL